MTTVSHPPPEQPSAGGKAGVLAIRLRFAAAATVAGLALLMGAGAPARAQFFSNYPVVVVPPPPAQNLILPKRSAPKPNPTQTPQPPAQRSEEFHGQTREPVGRF